MSEVSYYLEKYNGMTKEQLIAELITVHNVTLTNLERANHKVKKLLKQTIKENVGGSDELNTIIGGVDSSILVNAENANDLLSASSGNITSKITSIKTNVGGNSTLDANVTSLNTTIGGSGNITSKITSIKTDIGGNGTLIVNVASVGSSIGGSGNMATNVTSIKAVVGGNSTLLANVTSIKADVGGNSTLLSDVAYIKTDVGGNSTLLANVTSIKSSIGGTGNMTDNVSSLNTFIGGSGNMTDNVDSLNTNVGGSAIDLTTNVSSLNTTIGGSEVDLTTNVDSLNTSIGGSAMDLTTNVTSIKTDVGGSGDLTTNVTSIKTDVGGTGNITNNVSLIKSSVGGSAMDLTTNVDSLNTSIGGTGNITNNVTSIKSSVGGNSTLFANINTIKTDVGGNSTLLANVASVKSSIGGVENLATNVASLDTSIGGSLDITTNVSSINSKISSGSTSTLVKLNSVISDVDMFDSLLILPEGIVNATVSNFGVNGEFLSFNIGSNVYNYKYLSTIFDGDYIDFIDPNSLKLSLKYNGTELNGINAVSDYTNVYFTKYNYILTKELKTKISNVSDMLVATKSDLLQDVTNIVNKVNPIVTLDSSLTTIRNKLGYSNNTLDNNVNDLSSYVSPVQNDFADSNVSITSITKSDPNIFIYLNGGKTYSYVYQKYPDSPIQSDSNITFLNGSDQLIIQNKSGSNLNYEALYLYLLYLYPQNTKLTWDIYPSLTNLNYLISSKENLTKSIYSLRSSITSNPSNSISKDISDIRDKIVLGKSINLESDIDNLITNRFGSTTVSTSFNDATSIEAKIDEFIAFLYTNKNDSNIVTIDFTNGKLTLAEIIDSVIT